MTMFGIPASGMVPARFLMLTSHLVLTLTLLMSRRDTELAVGLAVAVGLIGVELAGFLSGISMFSPAQSLLSIGLHGTATVAMSYLILDLWDCDLYWWIFSFCSCLPAIVELTIMVGVLGLKKPV